MEIEIMSRENIKPSSPTPSHLKTYKLSLLDQLMPSAHVPIIFFYGPINQTDMSIRLPKLKQSLSEALTSFYPFAGKVKDDLYIDCNDEGVSYTQAKVSCCLSDILGKPDSETIFKLLPGDSYFMESSGNGIPVAMIQVNVFKCGGVAIGTKTSHKIIDGPTSTAFLKAWAAIARGSGETVEPCFIAPSLFPQNDCLPKDTMLAIWPSLIKFGKGITKRFVFDASSVAILKARAASSLLVHRPTRVEAVSAFIWQCNMLASKAKHGCQRPSFLSLIVNLRGKKGTQLPSNSVGNLLWMTIAQCSAETERELHPLVGLLRESISKIDGDFVQKLSGEEGFSKVCECLQEFGEVYSNAGADYLTFTSLCNVGIYETDFGWGRPIWVTPGGITGPVFQNLVFLNETSVGDGIEAWLTLDEQDMIILERDTEILSFSALDPSPLS
ncbi:Anthranilate N-benzoyltransferase protein, putative [Ricinus communis]|uniref:Anthranilate N-benzoyltransferase protein, putative n=1 Tax=Ricinus communis TaxID=3988 RepID=B9R8I4_RICCO|nr:Anthranilate N-benzoyltransferase protein, putative [Ricinus communis]|eukprot:XP_025013437.1 vinorine synthase-like [Ricinus communis]